MPFRPWGFCGEPCCGPRLVGILWGRGHAAQSGFQAVRCTRAMPAARRAGQARSRYALQRSHRFLPGHNRHSGPLARARRATARYDRHLHEQQPRSPHRGTARAAGQPPIPLTPASSRDNRLPPAHESRNGGLPRRGCHGPAARAERRVFCFLLSRRLSSDASADQPVREGAASASG